MISPLRKRHRTIISVLMVIVPVLFVGALLVRPEIPVMETTPDLHVTDTLVYEQVLFEADDLWGEKAITTRLKGDQTPALHLAIELEPETPLNLADPLVYWDPSGATTGQLPASAYLLGPMPGTGSRQFSLPDTARFINGRLLLYSLAHQELIASATLTTQQ